MYIFMDVESRGAAQASQAELFSAYEELKPFLLTMQASRKEMIRQGRVAGLNFEPNA
jgi:hypothetical protein